MKDPIEGKVSSSKYLSGHGVLLSLIDEARSYCFGETVNGSTTQPDVETLTSFFPARVLNAEPWFNHAVYSVKDGSDEAELEASCRSRASAEKAFRRCQHMSLADTTFFLFHWSEKRTLCIFHYAEKAIEPER